MSVTLTTSVEWAPELTSWTGGFWLSGNMRVTRMNPDTGDVTVTTHAVGGVGSSQRLFNYIDITNVDPSGGFTGLQVPVSYNNVSPGHALYDLIAWQGNVDHLRLKCKPVADGSIWSWTGSYADIDDDVDDDLSKGGATFVATGVLEGDKLRVKLTPFPSNFNRTKDITVRMWYRMTRGTDLGIGLNCKIYIEDTGVVINEGRIPMLVAGAGDKHYIEVKFPPPHNWTATWIEIELEAIVNIPGGAPDPVWEIYALDAIVYGDETLETWVDYDSFFDIDLWSYFQNASPPLPYVITGSCYGNYKHADNADETTETYRDFVMAMLAHVPELHIFLGYTGMLTLKKLNSYASAADPFVISAVNGRLHAIKSIEVYDDRYVSAVSCLWNMLIVNLTPNTAANPDFDYLISLQEDQISTTREDRFEKLEIERRLINGNPTGGDDNVKIKRMLASMLHLWGRDVVTVEHTCSVECLQVEIGDIVVLDEPKIGMDEKKFTVVGRDFDIDNEEVTMLLYDLEFDN